MVWVVTKVLWAGVMLNRIFPDWTLTLLLVLLLAFLTTRVLRRGVRMWRAESADRARAQGPTAGAPTDCSGAAAEVSKAQQPNALANGSGMPHAKEVGGAAGADLGSGLGSGVGSGRVPSALHRAGSAAALVAFWAAFAGAQAGKSLVERCSLAFAGISAAQARRPLRSSLVRFVSVISKKKCRLLQCFLAVKHTYTYASGCGSRLDITSLQRSKERLCCRLCGEQ